MNCALSTLKYILFVTNILCCIFGALTFSACTYSLIEFNESESVKIPCILGAALSSILFLNSMLGCLGISRNSSHVTWIYAIIMFLLLMGQIAVIFLEPINFSQIANEVIIKIWKSDMESDYMMTMHEIKYKCCGIFGPSDYTQAGLTIPLSCYLFNNNTIETNLFNEGCAIKLTDVYSIHQLVEEISDWFLAGLEGVSALVAGTLAINFKNIQRRKLYQ